MKKPAIAMMVLEKLNKSGGPDRMKDEVSAKSSAARDVMQALKDDEPEDFEKALTSFVKACYDDKED